MSDQKDPQGAEHLSPTATRPAAQHSGGWSPIESAPAGGETFLAFAPHSQGGYMLVACRNSLLGIVNTIDGVAEPFTHWRPLPAAPTAAEPRPYNPAPSVYRTDADPSVAFYLAQLRHAYAHLVDGGVGRQKEFADGLISPAIRWLESMCPPENSVSGEPVESEPQGGSGRTP
jgi:hypothetical protein